MNSNEYLNIVESIKQEIRTAQYRATVSVNRELLVLYHSIGEVINEHKTWGSKFVENLAADIKISFPDATGYSVRNLKYMAKFALRFPDKEIVQAALAQITWYHHISLLSKVKDDTERAYYITETAQNGWSRDVMLMQIDNGYIYAKGHAINNFEQTLPPPQSDLAKYIFKDPYNFSFLGTVALQNELDIEKSLTSKITDFLLEMGRGFAYIGRQYHITVDGDDYYIDLLMYHLKLHCYVVVELKAVEFKPEFVSKLNFYISAVDDSVKSPEDKPTIGLLLCRSKSDKKAEFSLRGITQPMGIAQYETEKLFADVASALPQIEELERNIDNV